VSWSPRHPSNAEFEYHTIYVERADGEELTDSVPGDAAVNVVFEFSVVKPLRTSGSSCMWPTSWARCCSRLQAPIRTAAAIIRGPSAFACFNLDWRDHVDIDPALPRLGDRLQPRKSGKEPTLTRVESGDRIRETGSDPREQIGRLTLG
jgi:hypothetical protein